MRTVIYISAPYTIGDVAQNVRRAIDAADILLARGYIPFVPHLTHFWHFISPKSHRKWIEIDKVILERCDAVLRLDGESVGADEEVAHAEKLGKPIYWSIDEL
jgi:hypothetical protein